VRAAAGGVGVIRQGPRQADAHHSPIAFRILTLPLLLLDGTSGRVRRAVRLAPYALLAVDEHAGHILVGGFPSGRTGPIAVLDARSGSVVRAIPIRAGSGLSPIAVDDRTGQIAALGVGPVPAPDHWAWVPSRLRSLAPFLRRPSPINGTRLSIIDSAR